MAGGSETSERFGHLWIVNILFRDYLMTHLDAVARYTAAKRQAARQAPNLLACSELKAQAVEQIMKAAHDADARETPAQRALARSYLSGDGKVRFDIENLKVEHRAEGGAVLIYRLMVGRQGRPDERWVVDLPWDDSSFTDVLSSPAPDPDRLRLLVHIVRALLEEWWDTKAHNRQSAKMGRRLT